MFLSKRPRTFVSRLPVEYSGKELGRGSGLQLGKDSWMDLYLLLGKELHKKRSLFLDK